MIITAATRKAYLWVVWLAIPLVLLVLISVTLPYFGNMDDSVLLQLAATHDPFSYAHIYGWRPSYGYINNFSMLVTWPAYASGASFGAFALYSLNALITYFIVVIAALLISKSLGWHSLWPAMGFIGISFLWPFTSELLFFPSLQEKGVLLGAALILGWTSLIRGTSRGLILWASFILATLAAFSTKTHILIYIPVAITVLWYNYFKSSEPRRSVFLPLCVTVVWTLLSFLTVWLTYTGSYTSGIQGSRTLAFLFDSRFILIAGITFLYSISLLWNKYTQQKIDFAQYIPLVALFPTMGGFALWDMRNYYLAAFSLAIGMAFGSFINAMKRNGWKQFFAASSVILACAWCIFRLPDIWMTQGSVRDFLTSNLSEVLAQQGSQIAISCTEAPRHFNFYALELNREGLTFVAYLEAKNVKYYFADGRLCPLVLLDTSTWREAWTGIGDDSYRLYEKTS